VPVSLVEGMVLTKPDRRCSDLVYDQMVQTVEAGPLMCEPPDSEWSIWQGGSRSSLEAAQQGGSRLYVCVPPDRFDFGSRCV
jgi:hypothetical protein